MRVRWHSLSIAVVTTAAVFLLLDGAWLSVMGSRLYRPALGHVMREDFDVLAAAVFYLVYLAGVMVFVVAPARDGRTALWRGALFGLVCYATYDLTNQATVIDWPWHVTAIDLIWGALVTAVAAWAGCRASRVPRPASHANPAAD
jgi:uncharacterized membrane protein